MRKEINSKIILEKIKSEKENLRKKGVKKIGLFGSFVKNKQKQKSDMDFLVEFEKIDIDRYLYVLNLLEKLFKKKIDLIIENDLKPELKYVIKEAEYAKI